MQYFNRGREGVSYSKCFAFNPVNIKWQTLLRSFKSNRLYHSRIPMIQFKYLLSSVPLYLINAFTALTEFAPHTEALEKYYILNPVHVRTWLVFSSSPHTRRTTYHFTVWFFLCSAVVLGERSETKGDVDWAGCKLQSGLNIRCVNAVSLFSFVLTKTTDVNAASLQFTCLHRLLLSSVWG